MTQRLGLWIVYLWSRGRRRANEKLIVRPLEILTSPRAGHFSTLHLLASLRGQGAPKHLQCALCGILIPKLHKGLIISFGPGETRRESS
jgi:hypothetical protein